METEMNRRFIFKLFAGALAAVLAPIATVRQAPAWFKEAANIGRTSAPRCGVCSGPWGMCAHTGGPYSNLEGEFDGEVFEPKRTLPKPPRDARGRFIRVTDEPVSWRR